MGWLVSIGVIRVILYIRSPKSLLLTTCTQPRTHCQFYYCPDKCVSLILLLAKGRGRVFACVTVHYPAPGTLFQL